MAPRIQSKNRASKEMDFNDLENGLQIEEHALEEALQQQPDLFYRVSKELSILTSRRDAAKQAVSEAEAEADIAVRKYAIQKELKYAEGEIKSRVRLTKAVQDAMDELHDLNGQVGQYLSLKEAYQARSYALKDLAGLYIANYYGSNQDGRGSGQMRDHQAQTARRGMNNMRRERE